MRATLSKAPAAVQVKREAVQVKREATAFELDRSLLDAARQNDVSGFVDALRRGATKSRHASVVAAMMGHRAIIDVGWSLGALTAADLENVMISAAIGNHVSIVSIGYDLGVRDITRTFLNAAAWGRVDVMVWLRDIDPTQVAKWVDVAMMMAVRWGYRESATLCATWGARDFDRALCEAVRGREIAPYVCAILRLGVVLPEPTMSVAESLWWCRDRGATAFKRGLLAAAHVGNLEAADVLIGWNGAAATNDALIVAAGAGFVEVMGLCRDRGASQVDRALIAATTTGQAVAAELCLAWGATSQATARDCARRRGDTMTATILTEATLGASMLP